MKMGVFALALLMSALSACSPGDVWLSDLLSDPMAELELTDAELHSRSEQPDTRFQVTGFASRARVMQVFVVSDWDSAQLVLDDAIAQAEAHGWVFDGYEVDPAIFASKELSLGIAQLSYAFLEETGEPLKFVVIIEFRERY
jgi:hypothetical protein